MNETVLMITNILNYTFTAFFILECMFKIIAFDIRYFKKTWHIFDFVLVIISIIAFISGTHELGTTTQLIRTIRLGRTVYKFKQLKQLQIIFSTFLNTLSSLANVGSLMFLIIYIYSIIAVNLFGDVKLDSPLHKNLNF